MTDHRRFPQTNIYGGKPGTDVPVSCTRVDGVHRLRWGPCTVPAPLADAGASTSVSHQLRSLSRASPDAATPSADVIVFDRTRLQPGWTPCSDLATGRAVGAPSAAMASPLIAERLLAF